MKSNRIFLFFFLTQLLENVICQQQVGSFYFPVTVAPPPYEIPKPDRTDTVYDETVQLVQDYGEPTAAKDYKATEKWTDHSFPPVYNGMWKKQKLDPEIYKTDEDVTKNDVQMDTNSLYLQRAKTFVADSGLQMQPTRNAIRPASMGSEAKITMTQSTASAKTFNLLKEEHSKKPKKSNHIDAEVKRNDTVEIIPKMHEDLQKLIQEVNLLKTLVNKLMRHIYKKKNRRSTRKAKSIPPRHLFAKQTLDNSATDHFTSEDSKF